MRCDVCVDVFSITVPALVENIEVPNEWIRKKWLFLFLSEVIFGDWVFDIFILKIVLSLPFLALCGKIGENEVAQYIPFNFGQS